MIAGLRDRLFGAWKTTLAGLALLVALAWLHSLGADGIRALTGEVSALGDLLAAMTQTFGTVSALLASFGLALWRGRP